MPLSVLSTGARPRGAPVPTRLAAAGAKGPPSGVPVTPPIPALPAEHPPPTPHTPASSLWKRSSTARALSASAAPAAMRNPKQTRACALGAWRLRPGPAPSTGACLPCRARLPQPAAPPGKGGPGREGRGPARALGTPPLASRRPRARVAVTAQRERRPPTAATPRPLHTPARPQRPAAPGSLCSDGGRSVPRAPGAPAPQRRDPLPCPGGPARPHRTWAGSGTPSWPGCPPPPRPRAVGWSGRPWPRRPRRPRRLSAAARPAPGAGVAGPGRPARPRPRRCGAGGGEPGARRAPSSAPHAGRRCEGGCGGPGAPPPRAA